jgi:SWI/SNF-related matrix-associated actin-dependent regulator 1 of chromatin subfamily A
MFKTSERIETDLSKIDLSCIGNDWLGKLFPFQKIGIQSVFLIFFLIRNYFKFIVFRFGVSKKGRCIIADDMGLGKTIQAIGIVKYYLNDFPLLIVCPSSMR